MVDLVWWFAIIRMLRGKAIRQDLISDCQTELPLNKTKKVGSSKVAA